LIYTVGDLSVDTGRQSVSRSGAAISLPKLSYDLFLVLIRAAPNVVSLDEMMRQVWPGLIVSPETVSKRVMLLRDALDEDPRSPRYIAGLRGRGYQIIAAVSQMAEVITDATAVGDASKSQNPLAAPENSPNHPIVEPRSSTSAAITQISALPKLTRSAGLQATPVLLLAGAAAVLTAVGAWHLWSQAQASVENANVIPNAFAGTWVGTIETCSPTTTYSGPFTVAISNTQSDLLRLVYYGYGPGGAVRLTGSYDLRATGDTAKSVSPTGITYTLKSEDLVVNYPEICQHGVLHRQNLKVSP
jgi:DNA-binding winged helix-turn-helix (wHTH) protein